MRRGAQVPRVAGFRQAFDYLGTHAGLRSLGRPLARVPKLPVAVVATKTDTFTTNSTSYVDVTGLSVAITPSSASKKVSIRAVIQASLSTATGAMFFQLVRDSTAIAIGDAAGNRIQASAAVRGVNDAPDGSAVIEWQDEPATISATTYKIQARVTAGTGAVNRGETDTDDTAHGRFASFIRAVEED